jgi:HK97 family phage major capsid protein
MKTALQLKHERGQLHERLNEILSKAEQQGRDLTANEQKNYDEVDGQLRTLDRQIERREAAEQRDRDLATIDTPGGAAAAGLLRGAAESGEIRDVLHGEQTSTTIELRDLAHRDLSVGSDPAGGATVPQQFRERLYEHLVAAAAIRQTNATVVTTTGGEDLSIPTTTAHQGAAIVAEGDPIGEADPTFDVVTLGAFKYGNLTRVTSELLADTAIDLEGYLARDVGRAIGNTAGAHFVTGTGSGQPQGVVPAVTVGRTATNPDSVTADDLLALFFSVIPSYRRDGYWMMNDTTWADVRGLTDSQGRFLVGDLSEGAQARLLGRPVVIDPNVADIAANARSIVFGDFSGYYIREAGPLRIERSAHLGFDTDTVLFRGLLRLDGRLVDASGAIKALEHPAS